jgi:hypothetical protein
MKLNPPFIPATGRVRQDIPPGLGELLLQELLLCPPPLDLLPQPTTLIPHAQQVCLQANGLEGIQLVPAAPLSPPRLLDSCLLPWLGLLLLRLLLHWRLLLLLLVDLIKLPCTFLM